MEKDEKLREIKLSSELLYKGKIIDVYKDKVLCPNGHESTRELIRHCKASCVLAITDENKVIVERQYRYPYDDVLFEFPAGKCDPGEDPKTTAIRELEEETGYRANKCEYLGKMYPTCAYTDEVIYLYLATDLKKTQQHLDENEALDILYLTFDEIKALLNEDKFFDAKSLCALTFYNSKK